jgi:DNA-binding winged helix-turn-helix (wHTH) protein
VTPLQPEKSVDLVVDDSMREAESFSGQAGCLSEGAMVTPAICLLVARKMLCDIANGCSDITVLSALASVGAPGSIAEIADRLEAGRNSHNTERARSLAPLIGELNIDVQTLVITSSGRRVDLSPMAHRILVLLLRDAERQVTVGDIEQISQELRRGISANGVHQAISRLRKKLAEIDPALRIKTIRGYGYALELREGWQDERRRSEAPGTAIFNSETYTQT